MIKNKFSNILLHYGKSSAKTFGIVDKIIDILSSLKISYVELGGVEENPKSNLVYEGIKIVKKIILILF